MKLQNKSRQISLATIFICAIAPQVQAGLWDDIKNKTKAVTERVVNETVDEVVGDKPDTPPQPEPKKEHTPEPQKREPQKVAKSTEAPKKQTKEVESANFDVVGFKLGMSPDEVREKLLNYRDDFRIQVYNSIPASQDQKSEVIKKGGFDLIQNVDENNLPEHVYEIRAYVQGGNEAFEFQFLKPPASNTLYRINRGLNFTKDNAPEDKKIIDGLKGKYGSVVTEETSHGGLKWAYDDNGSLRRKTDSYLEQYCDGRGGQRIDENFPLLDKTGGCGTWVSAKLNMHTGTQFVRHLSVTIADWKSGVSNRKESKALIAQIKDQEMKSKKRDVPNF